jgi:hypothetical protein
MKKTELPINNAEVKKTVERVLNEPPINQDPNFATITKATIGDPVTVKNNEGDNAFIIVPLLTGEKASGYIRLEVNLKVSQVSIFGANANDYKSWVDASFFYLPPAETIDSILKKYPSMKMSKPIFSFSKSYAKWGWIVKLSNKNQLTILISPSGWSEVVNKKQNCEG